MSRPKVLIFDIETAPIIAHVWDLFDQNVSLNQIVKDWHVLSWSAKWFKNEAGEVFGPHDRVMYNDQRDKKDISDDKELLQGIWKLIDEADIVVTQNGKRFDVPRLNARFIHNGMQPPSSYKHIDTCQIAKRHFDFTSNKLEYMTDKLCKKYKKLKHKKFPGHELWTQCLKGNREAWNEMKKYNMYDVLSLEELYNVLKAWDNSINFNIYSDSLETVCKCGSKDFKRNGHSYTSVGKYRRYKCKKCGSEMRDPQNLLTKEKRESLKRRITG
jgi:hypothetical protein